MLFYQNHNNTKKHDHDILNFFSSSSSSHSLLSQHEEGVALICYPTSVASSCVFLEHSATCFCGSDTCNEDASIHLPLRGWTHEQRRQLGIPSSMPSEDEEDEEEEEDEAVGEDPQAVVKIRRHALDKDAELAIRSVADDLVETQVEARQKRNTQGQWVIGGR